MLLSAIYQGNNVFQINQDRGVSPRLFYCPEPTGIKVGDKVSVDTADIVSNELTGAYMIRGGKTVKTLQAAAQDATAKAKADKEAENIAAGLNADGTTKV